MSRIGSLCLAVLVAAPATSWAESGWYVGIGGGGTRVATENVDLSFEIYTTGVIAGLPPYDGPGPFIDPAAHVTDPEGTDFALKLFGGWRWGRHLGVELGWVDLGTAEDSFSYQIPQIDRAGGVIRPVQDRQIDTEVEIDGLQVYLVGYWPLGKSLELFGKVGMLAWDRDSLVIDEIAVLTPVDQPTVPEIRLDGEPFTQIAVSDDGEDLALGAGVNIAAGERISLRGEFEWFDIEDTSQAWLASVSLLYAF